MPYPHRLSNVIVCFSAWTGMFAMQARTTTATEKRDMVEHLYE